MGRSRLHPRPGFDVPHPPSMNEHPGIATEPATEPDPNPRDRAPAACAITCTQPGRGWVMRLELRWGGVRRWYLRSLRPGYVRRMAELRRGHCPDCTHDIIDSRDLKFFRNVCGYSFEPKDDRFVWRSKLPIARAGWAELWVFTIVCVVLSAGGAIWTPWAALPGLLGALFVVSFFRDPHRAIPQDAGAIVSPADGTVTDIEELDVESIGPARKIGIFLSVFNVHVNRSPEASRVIELKYFPGAFHDARRSDARTANEQFWILMEGDGPPRRRFLIKQIAGAIARRIVCDLRLGEVVARGARIGMIKFGSRTELYLPREPGLTVAVAPGDRVRGGTTVVARYDVV